MRRGNARSVVAMACLVASVAGCPASRRIATASFTTASSASSCALPAARKSARFPDDDCGMRVTQRRGGRRQPWNAARPRQYT